MQHPKVYNFDRSQLALSDEAVLSPLQQRFYRRMHHGAAPPTPSQATPPHHSSKSRSIPRVARITSSPANAPPRLRLVIYGLSSCKRTIRLRRLLGALGRRDALGRLGYKFRDFTRISDQAREDLAERLLVLTGGTGGTIHMPVVECVQAGGSSQDAEGGGGGALLIDPTVDQLRAALRKISIATRTTESTTTPMQQASPPPPLPAAPEIAAGEDAIPLPRISYGDSAVRSDSRPLPGLPPPPPTEPPPIAAWSDVPDSAPDAFTLRKTISAQLQASGRIANTQRRLREMMQRLDTQERGVLSRDEFYGAMAVLGVTIDAPSRTVLHSVLDWSGGGSQQLNLLPYEAFVQFVDLPESDLREDLPQRIARSYRGPGAAAPAPAAASAATSVADAVYGAYSFTSCAVAVSTSLSSDDATSTCRVASRENEWNSSKKLATPLTTTAAADAAAAATLRRRSPQLSQQERQQQLGALLRKPILRSRSASPRHSPRSRSKEAEAIARQKDDEWGRARGSAGQSPPRSTWSKEKRLSSSASPSARVPLSPPKLDVSLGPSSEQQSVQSSGEKETSPARKYDHVSHPQQQPGQFSLPQQQRSPLQHERGQTQTSEAPAPATTTVAATMTTEQRRAANARQLEVAEKRRRVQQQALGRAQTSETAARTAMLAITHTRLAAANAHPESAASPGSIGASTMMVAKSASSPSTLERLRVLQQRVARAQAAAQVAAQAAAPASALASTSREDEYEEVYNVNTGYSSEEEEFVNDRERESVAYAAAIPIPIPISPLAQLIEPTHKSTDLNSNSTVRVNRHGSISISSSPHLRPYDVSSSPVQALQAASSPAPLVGDIPLLWDESLLTELLDGM